MQEGLKYDSIEVLLLVEKLQNYITDNYYTCTKDILAGLGQMYVLDERFKKNIDQNGEGTAEFISSAISFYCTEQAWIDPLLKQQRACDIIFTDGNLTRLAGAFLYLKNPIYKQLACD